MIVTIGTEIPSTRKTVYQRALDERQWSAESIHNDEYTKTKGYPGALVSAYVISGYISELMMKFFGESWASTGRYKLSFIGTGLQQGNLIDCRGFVRSISDEDAGRRVTCDVWIEKDGGAKAVVGEASAILRG